MLEELQPQQQEQLQSPSNTTLLKVTGVILAVYVIGSLVFLFQMNSRISAAKAEIAQARQELKASQEQLKAAGDMIAERMGMTQKQFAARTAALQQQQKLADLRLAEEQKKQQEVLGLMTGEVQGVKSEVGGVKSDAANMRSELEAAKVKLERAIGDLGLQSGLIATTREQLDLLKQRGERNYFEFTLAKGARPVPVSTISLQLKKADRKKGKFTLNVLADDRTIEKKDKNVNEPVQFYTGGDRRLYELVVFAVEKDKISGYLSTPKVAMAMAR